MKHIALIAFLVLAACSHGPSDTGVNIDKDTGLPIPSTYSFAQRTAGGVAVQANVDVPQAALDLIDAGIATQIERSAAQHPEWTAGNNLSEYELIFIDPMATNVETDPGSPALLIGSPWPVQAAGTCIGAYGTRMIIVLPHQAGSGWTHTNYLRESARNESEHIRLGFAANNAKDLFDHYQGPHDIHPIFP